MSRVTSVPRAAAPISPHSPSKVRGFDGLTEDFRHCGGLDRVVRPGPGYLLYRFDHVVCLGSVYGVGRTQLAGQFQTIGFYVHGDDLGATGYLRGHDCAHPYRARPEDGDAATRLGMQGVQYPAGSGLYAAPERAE